MRRTRLLRSPDGALPEAARRTARVAPLALALGGLVALASLAACKPKIGDGCQVSTDCSVSGDRLCDTSQPNGYCTQLNCAPNACPDEGSCVLFGSSVPGCGFDDRGGPLGSRVSRAFCMAECESSGDCRPGYVCADPRTFPWNAVILDDAQGKRSCLPRPIESPDAAVVVPVGADVCNATAGDAGTIEAGAPSIDDAGLPIPPLFPEAGAPADAAADGG